MSASPDTAQRRLAGRVAGQGALLMSGFALSQALSFGRNAILGHMLAKGDFGIAAILTLLLQLLDSLTDLGVDRLIVQARDGNRPRFVAANHAALAARGVLIGVVLLFASGPIARFFDVPEAQPTIALLSIVPLIKGLQHLDARRAQRRLENRPFLAIEVLPQALAFVLTWPVLAFFPDYRAVLWLSVVQALTAVAVSHLVAERRYRIVIDREIFKRLVQFGWPIWLSAFPLVAVYQGDRIAIGHLVGMEALAAYSAAFLIAMVPGLIAAKVGHALMLPLLAAVRHEPQRLAQRFAALTEATAVVAAVYLTTAMLLGGFFVQLAFGPQYAGLDAVMAWLAAMWAIRMLQAVPGMVLLATGDTKPFLAAGLIRATALIPAVLAAAQGAGLETIAAIGFVGEVASLVYVSWRMEQLSPGLSRVFVMRAAFVAPAAALAGLTLLIDASASSLVGRSMALFLVLGLIAGLAGAAMPEARSQLRALRRA